MSESPRNHAPERREPKGTEAARSLLDRLFTDGKLYTRSRDYKELYDFVARLRGFAPFNALLLHIQKPGLSYAASARDWRLRFDRELKDGARPLLVLQPFGPVALVYDVIDTEGRPLPRDVASFSACGPVDANVLTECVRRIASRGIEWYLVDAGDRSAGAIRVMKSAATAKEHTQYRLYINRNHPPVTQFVTLAHELGHLFLGHLGVDKKLNAPSRESVPEVQRELEAESVAYLVCARQGVTSRSEPYLSQFFAEGSPENSIDIYQVMRAAGQVETLLGFAERSRTRGPGSAESLF